MSQIIEELIDGLHEGRLTRRQVVAGLTALVASAVAAPRASAPVPAPPAPTLRAIGLNHVALRVTDLDRSTEFYRRHLGLGLLRDGSQVRFMSCGGNNFLALFRFAEAGLDHYCYTVPDYDAAATVQTLKTAGLTSERQEDRVYFKDPDGITVQVTGQWDDYPGPRPRS